MFAMPVPLLMIEQPSISVVIPPVKCSSPVVLLDMMVRTRATCTLGDSMYTPHLQCSKDELVITPFVFLLRYRPHPVPGFVFETRTSLSATFTLAASAGLLR